MIYRVGETNQLAHAQLVHLPGAKSYRLHTVNLPSGSAVILSGWRLPCIFCLLLLLLSDFAKEMMQMQCLSREIVLQTKSLLVETLWEPAPQYLQLSRVCLVPSNDCTVLDDDAPSVCLMVQCCVSSGNTSAAGMKTCSRQDTCDVRAQQVTLHCMCR